MWVVPAWGLTFQIPQQTVIIRIVSQGIFTKCYVVTYLLQSSSLLFEAIFSLIILCYMWKHQMLLTYSNTCLNQSYNVFNNLLPLTINFWYWQASNFPFQYHPWIKHSYENKSNNDKLKNLLIVKNKFSLPAHNEVYWEQYGELACWC